MRIFIDSADVNEVRELVDWGVLSGATTNPSLLSKASGDPLATLGEICEILRGPVSAEVVSQDFDGMVGEGRRLSEVSEHVVVKVPVTPEGLKTCDKLTREDTPVNVTLVFNVQQALLAANAGATYISPFIGRLDDIGQNGVEVLTNIVDIFQFNDIRTQIIAASVRSSRHVAEIATAGADIATLPPAVIRSMVEHPLTRSGLEKFLSDWKRSAKDFEG